MKNTMLDVETFGTSPGCVIRSIGAATFALDGTVGEKFYANVSRQSCEAIGLTVDPDTEKWWSEQPAAARNALEIGQVPITEALNSFRTWFAKQNAPLVWAQGANFDPGIMEAAYKAAKIPVPWKFWNVRDTRTVYDLFGFDTRDFARARVHHNALDDTLHQIALVAAALRKGRPAAQVPTLNIFG